MVRSSQVRDPLPVSFFSFFFCFPFYSPSPMSASIAWDGVEVSPSVPHSLSFSSLFSLLCPPSLILKRYALRNPELDKWDRHCVSRQLRLALLVILVCLARLLGCSGSLIKVIFFSLSFQVMLSVYCFKQVFFCLSQLLGKVRLFFFFVYKC